MIIGMISGDILWMEGTILPFDIDYINLQLLIPFPFRAIAEVSILFITYLLRKLTKKKCMSAFLSTFSYNLFNNTKYQLPSKALASPSVSREGKF